MLAIIGGTGTSQLANLRITRRQVVRTPYGDPSGPLTFGEIDSKPVVFIARHGYGYTIPPHQINYRANLWALAEHGVTRVIAIASVGGIRSDLAPGALVVPDQIIDYTWGRKQTIFDGGDTDFSHVDFTLPYDQDLRSKLLEAAARLGRPVIDGGTYACMQGPRLETAAEIRRIRNDGGDMVGMTAMPEAALARELGLQYATLAVVVNWAAGIADSESAIAFDAATQVFADGVQNLQAVLAALLDGPN
ncbi:S-methyl-5'-thioinosine phosphorylase [Andreprevotia chitinilytica]|uniref:S-methyl-5'-thioinosine phosphorylase n=1 Tax=Andreprevotia chitinilytica TaxID=396808 RepID=UPI00054CF9B1|nr:S-methyl-5'-thioinosine phosphorylase [Andreprevotia chitinilytica]